MMYAVQYHDMFVRKGGLLTEDKIRALLFDTEQAALMYVSEWMVTQKINNIDSRQPVLIIEVEVKPVLHKVGRKVWEL